MGRQKKRKARKKCRDVLGEKESKMHNTKKRGDGVRWGGIHGTRGDSVGGGSRSIVCGRKGEGWDFSGDILYVIKG